MLKLWNEKSLCTRLQKIFQRRSKKKKRSIDVIFVVQTRINREEIIKYMFIMMILYLNIEQKMIQIIIDCDATFNFIFQMKIKKWNLRKIVDVSSKLKTLNDTFFKCYEAHVLRIKMIDSSKREIRIKQTIIVANMTKIHMILSFFWLTNWIQTLIDFLSLYDDESKMRKNFKREFMLWSSRLIRKLSQNRRRKTMRKTSHQSRMIEICKIQI
jgi:hypothetical protein